MPEWITSLPLETIVLAIIGFGGAWVVARNTNRKIDREGADAISRAAVQLVEPLEQRLDEADKENELLRVRISALEAEARELETMRFENQHLRERVKYLEMQVELLQEKADYRTELEEALLAEREKVSVLIAQIEQMGATPTIE